MWRALSEDDLVSALSQREVDAFRASCGTADDPVGALLAATAETVRAFVRRNHSVAMSPVPATIPEGLVRCALALAAYDVLKRLPVPVGEDRRTAKADALDMLARVADGKLVPESFGAEEPSGATVLPSAASPAPPRTLD